MGKLKKEQKPRKMTLAGMREAANLTQKELADILGITDQTVSNWEQGRSFPKLTVRQVAEMLTVLPCTLSELVEICNEIERQAKSRSKPKHS